MMCARRQVLSDRQHVHMMHAKIAHHLQDLFVGLAKTDHDAALRRHVRNGALELREQLQRVHVVRSRTRVAIQPRHGFQVVIHHVGRRGFQNLQRAVKSAAKIGHQHFNACRRRKLARSPNTVNEMLRAAVLQVVAIDRRDDDVRKLQRRNRPRQVERLIGVERIGASVADIAKRAAPRALVAHDHEGCSTFAETLADVRARRFLAHGVQIVLAQDALDFVKARGR